MDVSVSEFKVLLGLLNDEATWLSRRFLTFLFIYPNRSQRHLFFCPDAFRISCSYVSIFVVCGSVPRLTFFVFTEIL